MYLRVWDYDNYTMCIKGWDTFMDYSKKIKEIRESTGMNRKEFCEYFNIPYGQSQSGKGIIDMLRNMY